MQSTGQTVPVSKTMLWAGRILGAVAVVFLLFDAVLHLMKPAPVAAAFAQLGYPLDLAVGIGILELVSVAVYVIPRTSLLGAILLTGYLGLASSSGEDCSFAMAGSGRRSGERGGERQGSNRQWGQGGAPVKITYLGHATFLVESGSTTILIDPFDAKVGYPMPTVGPTAVLVSHEHGDHNHLAMASGAPKIIRGLADGQWRTVKEQVDGVAIASVPTYHDATQGKERGRNTVFVIDAEGLRVVHLGDLGHPLDAAAVKAIGRPDVLMVPIGGHYTTDANQAHDVVARLRPGIVIPM
ncbi:MAG: hypothetical protein E6H03_06420, partial [Bacillati bacterium ANGP1]